MNINIIGAGLAGSVIASAFPDAIIYERDKVGGLCRDNDNYQDFVHVLHTDNKKVWDFVNNHTTVRPHTTILKSYVKGELKPWPAPLITDQVVDEQITGYSRKMWLKDTPKEAVARITTADDGLIFHEKYQGIPDFTRLFRNLTRYNHQVKDDIKDGDLDGLIVLTGAIDEYFDYCYGRLPYRGMQAVHYSSEIGLDADFITFSDEQIPFQRLVDYGRLGYNDCWIGVESACDAKHYPIRDDKSEAIYEKYKQLADEKGIILCGRLATFHYMDMDEVINQAMEVIHEISRLHTDAQ